MDVLGGSIFVALFETPTVYKTGDWGRKHKRGIGWEGGGDRGNMKGNIFQLFLTN